MSVLEAVIYTIKQDSTVQSLVGSRVHSDHPTQDATKPCLIVYVVSENPEDCLSGFVGFETATVRVEAYGTDRRSARETLQAARLSLDGLFGVVQGTPIKGVSQNTGSVDLADRPNDGTDRWLFRSVQSFDVTYNSFEAG